MLITNYDSLNLLWLTQQLLISMSQRRGGGAKESGGAVQNEEVLPFSKVLDTPSSGVIGVMDRESTEPAHAHAHAPTSSSSSASASTSTPAPAPAPTNEGTAVTSVSLDARYHAESQQIRTKQWQESYFARGCTLSTWEAEYAQLKDNGWKGECSKMMDGNDSNSVPCGCCSAIMCSALGAGRVGNMAVLKQSNEWVAEEVPDEENGGTKTERFTRPRLDFVAGPVSEKLSTGRAS